MNDIKWTQGRHRMKGPTAKTTHWIIRLDTVQQFWTSVSLM